MKYEMKKINILKITGLIFVTFFIVVIVATIRVSTFDIGHTVFAQGTPATLQTNPANPPTADGGVGSNVPTNPRFQLVSCDGVQKYLKDAKGNVTTTLDPNSKECDYEQLVKTVSRLIQFALYILIPIVLGMIIYVGFAYLTSGGDSAKLSRAKGMIKPLLIGIFLIFAAWLIVYTFLDKLLVDDLKRNIVPTSIKS